MRERIREWVRDSETIAWARFQMVLGAIVAGLQTPEVMTAILSSNDLPWQQIVVASVIFLNGAVTEYLRRRRDEEMR